MARSSGSRSKGSKGKSMGNQHRLSPMEYSDPLRRKQTIVSLIDMLSELSNDVALDRGSSDRTVVGDLSPFPMVEGELPISVDERLSNTGAEQFSEFEKRIKDFDAELRAFATATRHLGSSTGILSATFKLRERLAKILFLFRENAASLYPRKVARKPREFLGNPNQQGSRWADRHPPPVTKLILEDNLEPDTLPAQLESFAKDIATFLNRLNEFPEFSDEALNQSMRGFEGDLKYWASCLSEYKNQFRSPPVQRYVHELITEIGDQIDDITGMLSAFTEIGIPTIKFHQQRAETTSLNLSIVATLFSIVTTTSLQFSHGSTGKVLSNAVNAFWFSSLVFSIAAAVNSLVGYAWKQTVYRSPGHRVPWWILIWLKRFPLVFMIISIACYSVGLVLFTYSSGQGPVTSAIITTLTAVTSFGLASVAAWFISERFIFIRHRGQKWLAEVISETIHGMASTRAVRAFRICFLWCSVRIANAREYLRRLVAWVNRGRPPPELLPVSGPPQAQARPRVPARSLFYSQEQSSASASKPMVAGHKPLSRASESHVSGVGRTAESATTIHLSDTGQKYVDVGSSVDILSPKPELLSPSGNS